MPRCTRLVRHQGDCEYNLETDRYWEELFFQTQDLRCDFNVVVMPYNDFLDKFESRDE